MSRRYLFGPVSRAFASEQLREARASGACVAFDFAGETDLAMAPGDSWESVCGRLPHGWRPEFVVVCLGPALPPACLWRAPLPLVAWAPDWDLHWHGYRRRLRCCERVLVDPNGADLMAREGISHCRAANYPGRGRAWLEAAWPGAGDRDIDVLFVGGLHPAVRHERLAWLGRLARLGERCRVAIRTGVPDDEYRRLLGRARVVFGRSARGACGPRVFEAAAAGALVFQEAGNREIGRYLRDSRECVLYEDATLEPLLAHHLGHEDERRRLAEAARARARSYGFEDLWQEELRQIVQDWPGLVERARRRPCLPPLEDLLSRTWEVVGAAVGDDPALVPDLVGGLRRLPQRAALHNALGLALTRAAQGGGPVTSALAEQAAYHFRRALDSDPSFVVAGLNLAEALAGLELAPAAVAVAQRTLATLDGAARLPDDVWDAAHFPPALDQFRVEWERAAWSHAGAPAAEAEAKRGLLRWRLQALLANLTGDLAPAYGAVLARPDLAPARAALGSALARRGRLREAATHLEQAVARNPFDRGPARLLFEVLGQLKDAGGQTRLARERRLLARAAPEVVPAEDWFREPAAAGTPADEAVAPASPRRPRVSLCLIARDEEANLPACLGSARDLVDEVIVVDTGSTDRTREVAAGFGARVFEFPWCDSFAAARNESLRHAAGDWIFWLDADDRLDEADRQKLRDLFAALPAGNVAYAMKCLCLPEPSAGTATVVDHIRLFRNHPDIRWQYRVHEQILPAVRRSGGDVRWTDVVIQHTGYQDPEVRQRKRDRDLRLLRLDQAEHPDGPFVLFNQGSLYLDLGRPAEALPALRRSLGLSQPRDSIVRKLYAMIVQCHRQQGKTAEAAAACRDGRALYPEDAELLYQEALVRREQGDLPGAEEALLRLLGTEEQAHFASIDVGLRGHKARHNLAVVYREQGRAAEAEAQWRAAVAAAADFVPARVGLAELYLEQQRWADFDEAVARVEALPQGALDAGVLRARRHLAGREFAQAQEVLRATIARHPGAVWPRVLFSRALLQEGRDCDAAERALRDVLAVDPGHPEARRNLLALWKAWPATGFSTPG
jgi:tetratricopeptide (TPR) repeat protein